MVPFGSAWEAALWREAQIYGCEYAELLCLSRGIGRGDCLTVDVTAGEFRVTSGARVVRYPFGWLSEVTGSSTKGEG